MRSAQRPAHLPTKHGDGRQLRGMQAVFQDLAAARWPVGRNRRARHSRACRSCSEATCRDRLLGCGREMATDSVATLASGLRCPAGAREGRSRPLLGRSRRGGRGLCWPEEERVGVGVLLGQGCGEQASGRCRRVLAGTSPACVQGQPKRHACDGQGGGSGGGGSCVVAVIESEAGDIKLKSKRTQVPPCATKPVVRGQAAGSCSVAGALSSSCACAEPQCCARGSRTARIRRILARLQAGRGGVADEVAGHERVEIVKEVQPLVDGQGALQWRAHSLHAARRRQGAGDCRRWLGCRGRVDACGESFGEGGAGISSRGLLQPGGGIVVRLAGRGSSSSSGGSPSSR